MPQSTRDAAQDILNRSMARNEIKVDPDAVQGPVQAGNNIRTIIQPIVVYKKGGAS